MNEDREREQREFAQQQIERATEIMKAGGVSDAAQARCLATLRGLFELAEQHDLALMMVVRMATGACEETGHNHTPRIESLQVELSGFEPEPDERDALEADYVKVVDLAGLEEFLKQRTRETRSN